MSSFFINCVALTLILQSCGLTDKSLLRDVGNIPLELQRSDYSQRQTSQDLIQDPLDKERSLLEDFAKCRGSQTLSSIHITSFLQAHSRHKGELNQLGDLPDAIPALPGSEEVKKGLREFVASGRKITPRDKVIESVPNSVLVQRYLGAKRGLDPKTLLKFETLISKNAAKITGGTERWFYAYSLEPSNEYQWLVKCTQLNLTLTSGTITSHLWPSFSALETDTLSKSGKLLTSLRPKLEIELDNGFSIKTSEQSGTQIQKSPSRLTYKLRWSDPLGDRMAIYFREADSLFFSRFFSFFKSKTTPESVGSSFQMTGQKASYEFSTDENGQKKQTAQFQDAGCSVVGDNGDKSFVKGGMHYLDQNTFFVGLEAQANNSETIPLSEGEQLCQSLYATDPK